MDEQTLTSDGGRETVWRRRGLFAAFAAAVAGIVMKHTTQPVEAAGTVTLANGIVNASNNETVPTYLHNTGSNTFRHDDAAMVGESDNGPGVYGTVNYMNTPQVPFSVGVYGDHGSASGIGVHGLCVETGGMGVRGTAAGTSGIGVFGEVLSSSNQNGTAIYGLNYSTYAGSGPGAGGFGVYGLSAKGHGLVGATATAGAAAVVGATNSVAGAYAGAFYGPVIVGGAFTVFGAKSAAVPHPDGSHRRLYCVESPESWFEDFGKGQLEGGCSTVAIDPDFAAVVDLTDYHVFLTGYDDFDLRVSEQTASNFHVVARDGESSGRFSWRIVAKRKDIAAPRFATVTVLPEPTLPVMREPPTPPSVLRTAMTWSKGAPGERRGAGRS